LQTTHTVNVTGFPLVIMIRFVVRLASLFMPSIYLKQP